MKVAGFTSAVLVATALSLFACGGRGNTKGNVEQALDQANIPNVAVNVDERDRVVHLKGTVGSMSDRTRAEEVASAAVGTTGRVMNELTVEGVDTQPSSGPDAQIQDILDRLVDDDPVLRERDINFKVENAAVTATGEVRSAAEKEKVTHIVKRLAGVKDFSNALEIQPEQ